MSRVRIADVYSDYYAFVIDDVNTVEIVPRKIIEQIIKKCDYDMERLNSQYSYECGVINEAERIKDYAESLLKQFEEDKE